MRHFGIDEAWPLIYAARWTVPLTLARSAAASGARLSPLRFVRLIAADYIRRLQGLPLLILLFLVFFGANIVGLRIDPRTAAAIGYGLYGSAFLGEIWRGSCKPCHAANVTLRLPARCHSRGGSAWLSHRGPRAVPPSVGFMVELLKSTSLAVAARHPAGTTPVASVINAAPLPNFSQGVPANELRSVLGCASSALRAGS